MDITKVEGRIKEWETKQYALKKAPPSFALLREVRAITAQMGSIAFDFEQQIKGVDPKKSKANGTLEEDTRRLNKILELNGRMDAVRRILAILDHDILSQLQQKHAH